MNDKLPRVIVIGVGNLLLKDEGIGIHAINALQEVNLPQDIRIIDGGTAPDLIAYTEAGDKLIIIDAMKAGNKAGTVYKAQLKAEELDSLVKIFNHDELSKTSLHHVGLLDVLKIAEKINCCPDRIVIIGVEPGQIESGLNLTDLVERKLPKIIEKVLEEIEDDIHRE